MRCIAAERPKNKAHGASRGRKQNGDKPRRGGRALPRTLFQRRISASDALGYQHFSAAFQPQTLLGRAALQRCISAPDAFGQSSTSALHFSPRTRDFSRRGKVRITAARPPKAPKNNTLQVSPPPTFSSWMPLGTNSPGSLSISNNSISPNL